MQLRNLQLVFFVACPLLSGCSPVRLGNVVTTTSICEIAGWTSENDGSRVRLTAVFDTDGVENSVLRDLSCPGVVVAPRDAPEGDREVVSSLAFDAMVYKPGLHRIEIDVTGVFRWRAGAKPNATFEMERFWSIVELSNQ
jgi:hypothetical protein